MSDEIKWLPPIEPTKHSLIHGIRETIKAKTGLADLPLEFLERIGEDNLLMIAAGMGFQHDLSKKHLENINQREIDRLERSRLQAEIRRKEYDEAAKRKSAQAMIIDTVKKVMSDAAIEVIAAELLSASDEEIRTHAIARGVAPEILLKKVQDLRA